MSTINKRNKGRREKMKNCKYCKELRKAKSEYTLKDLSNEYYCDEGVYRKDEEWIGKKSGLTYHDVYNPGIDPDGAEHINCGPY